MFCKLNRDTQIKPGSKWVGVSTGMWGQHFSTVMWLNPDMGGFIEPWEKCSSVYHQAYEKAQEEAYWYAAEHALPFDLPGFIEPESPL